MQIVNLMNYYGTTNMMMKCTIALVWLVCQPAGRTESHTKNVFVLDRKDSKMVDFG